MSEGPASLRVAAIGDVHVHQTSNDSLRGIFERVSQDADVLAMCGDLTHLGLPQEAERLVDLLRAFRVPVVAVLGNHDYQSGQAEAVKKVLQSGKVVILEEAETFEIKGVGFAGAKGFGGGFNNHML